MRVASSRAAAPRVPCALLSRTPSSFGVAGALNWCRPPQYRRSLPQTKIRKPDTFRCQQCCISCKSGKSTRNRALQSRGEHLSQQARSHAFRSSKEKYTHPMPARRRMLRGPETPKLYSKTKCPCDRCGTPRTRAGFQAPGAVCGTASLCEYKAEFPPLTLVVGTGLRDRPLAAQSTVRPVARRADNQSF